MNDVVDPGLGRERIEELESRVKWLEGALTSMLQQRRRDAGRSNQFDTTFSLDDDDAPVQTRTRDNQDRTQPLKVLQIQEAQRVAEAQAAAAEQLFPEFEMATASGRSAAAVVASARKDPMSFTSSFATLDERLREQIENESTAVPAHDMAPPVLIDPSLIDLAFAPPAPRMLEVRCFLEESYPHLLSRIITLWGEPELVSFLHKLIVDDRGSRQGFPFEVMSELMTLSALVQAPQDEEPWIVASKG